MHIYISRRTLWLMFIALLWSGTVLFPIGLGVNGSININDAFILILLLSPVAWVIIYQVMRRIEKLEQDSDERGSTNRHLWDESSPEYEALEDLVAVPKRKNR